MNTLVMDGHSFRDAYQQVGAQVQSGTYNPESAKEHTHIGSMGNLCLDKIREKFDLIK